MTDDVRVMRDENLDNNASAIQKTITKIDRILKPIDVSVVDTVEYIDSTLFVLSPNSVSKQTMVHGLFRNKHRYAFEFVDTTVDDIIEDEGYIGRMPSTRKTIAIRRVAFKKLPRPILCSFLYQTCLLVLLSALLFAIYSVALL